MYAFNYPALPPVANANSQQRLGLFGAQVGTPHDEAVWTKMYAYNYPALPPVANALAQERLRLCVAPAIVAGTPLDEALLQSAICERKARLAEKASGGVTLAEVAAALKREHAIMHEHVYHKYWHNAVQGVSQGIPQTVAPAPTSSTAGVAATNINATDGEIAAALVRQHGIMHEHVRHEYWHRPASGVSQWFTPAVVQSPATAASTSDANKTSLTALTASVTALIQQMTRVENGVKRMQMDLTNAHSLVRNQAVDRLGKVSTHVFCNTPFAPFIKTDEAIGAGTPGAQPIHPMLLPRVTVGDPIPSPPFPTTCEDLESMTMDQINKLAMLMNTDFGIQQDDDVRIRRSKLRRFLAYGLCEWT